LGLSEYLTEQGKPPLALEAFEEGGPVDLGVVAICEILKKIPTALKQAQAAADSSFQPKLVWEGGAVPAGSGELEKPAKGFEELATDNGFADRRVRYNFFQTQQTFMQALNARRVRYLATPRIRKVISIQ
jgi:hypothetical protein